jgi:hypothetical protein
MAGRYPGRKRNQVDYTLKEYGQPAWFVPVRLAGELECLGMMLNNRPQQAVLFTMDWLNFCYTFFASVCNLQILKTDEAGAHSPELGGVSQRKVQHGTAHDSTAAAPAAARKSVKSAASKLPQAAVPEPAGEHDYVAPDTAPPLFKRLENHKRSLSGSDSGQSDQGPAKKKRGRPSKQTADNIENKPIAHEDEQQVNSSKAAAAEGPTKKEKKQGKESRPGA